MEFLYYFLLWLVIGGLLGNLMIKKVENNIFGAKLVFITFGVMVLMPLLTTYMLMKSFSR